MTFRLLTTICSHQSIKNSETYFLKQQSGDESPAIKITQLAK